MLIWKKMYIKNLNSTEKVSDSMSYGKRYCYRNIHIFISDRLRCVSSGCTCLCEMFGFSTVYLCVYFIYLSKCQSAIRPSVLVFTTVVLTDYAVSLEFVHGTNQY